MSAQRSGDHVRAERLYAGMLERCGELVPVLVNLASVRMALGRPSDALALLRRALEIEPGHVNANVQLGLTCASLGDHVAADSAFADALLLDPEHIGSINNRAILLEAVGRYGEAFDHHARA